MVRDPKGKRWAIFSFIVLILFSVSVAGQGTLTSVVSPSTAVENQRSDSTVDEVGQESGSMQSGHSPDSVGSLSGGRGDAARGKEQDLTAFFAVGFIVNILLIGAFLFWARGQWRMTKSE